MAEDDRDEKLKLKFVGSLVEQLAPSHGGDVRLKLDEFNNTRFEGITPENFRGIDVAIDFSIPEGADPVGHRMQARIVRRNERGAARLLDGVAHKLRNGFRGV